MADEISLAEERLRRSRQERGERLAGRIFGGNVAEPAAEPPNARTWAEEHRRSDGEGKPSGGDGKKDAAEDAVPVENTPAYGFIRGGRHGAPFLEFQLLGQEWAAISAGYADLRRTRWAPSGLDGVPGAVFLLEYRDGLKAFVRGRNLRPLLDGIQRQVVFRLTEMGEEGEQGLPDDATVIYQVILKEPEEQAATASA